MAPPLKPQDKASTKKMTTAEDVATYQALMPLLTAMFGEFKELSKKKPDGVLNKRKIMLVNRLLKDVLAILEEEPSRPYLDLLDEDDVPQNSDVLLMLSQFEAAMEAYYNRYYFLDQNDRTYRWHMQ
jgi:hypothetical protein